MPKTDYYDDPAAPAPNSLVVAVAVFVQDAAGRVLMIRRGDNDKWALPGGGQDLGESTAQAGVREVREETGLDVRITGVVGIYSDPRHVIAYDDGEVRQEFSICLRGEVTGGTITTSEESNEVHWVEPERIPELTIDRSMRRRIDNGLDPTGHPYVD